MSRVEGRLRERLKGKYFAWVPESDKSADGEGFIIRNIVDGSEKHFAFSDDAAMAVHERYFGPLVPGSPFSFPFLQAYYEGLLVDVVESVSARKVVLTASPLLYKLSRRLAAGGIAATANHQKLISRELAPRFAWDILTTGLLDVSRFDVEDVLSIREKLRNELGEFRVEVERLTFEFSKEFGIEKLIREGRAIADARLTPRVAAIERKIRGGKHKLLKDLLKVIKKPGAYVPFFGALVAGLPLELATMLSAGLMSAEVALKQWKRREEVREDGMYYLVQLRRRRTQAARPARAARPKRKRGVSDAALWESAKCTPRYYVWPSELGEAQREEK